MKKSRRFAVGDIHGCSETFSKLSFDILKIEKKDEVYLLGDYIDRGPHSKKVVDMIIDLQKEEYSIFPIMGNHEKMLLDSGKSYIDYMTWIYNGANTTMESFSIDNIDELDKKYLDFFKCLPYYYELKDFILVHAGLNFDIPNPLEDKESMVWIRDDFVDKGKINGKRFICGHTPIPLEKIRKTLKESKIMLDGGCVYSGSFKGLGNLVALDLDSFELFVQTNIDF